MVPSCDGLMLAQLTCGGRIGSMFCTGIPERHASGRVFRQATSMMGSIMPERRSAKPAARKSAARKASARKSAKKSARKPVAKSRRAVTAKSTVRKTANEASPNRWSQRVTEESDALDLKSGVFTLKDPKKIAASLKRSAEHSARRKTGAYRSALSMLTFYINRAGKTLPKTQHARLERAKDELRKAFGKE